MNGWGGWGGWVGVCGMWDITQGLVKYLLRVGPCPHVPYKSGDLTQLTFIKATAQAHALIERLFVRHHHGQQHLLACLLGFVVCSCISSWALTNMRRGYSRFFFQRHLSNPGQAVEESLAEAFRRVLRLRLKVF